MAVESATAQTPGPDFVGVRTVSNTQQIYTILTGVQKSRTPITIKFEGREAYYTSLILRTDLDDAYMIIDEIAPESGHLQAMEKLPFSIRGSHNGVSLFFRPNVIAGSGIQNNIAFYKVPFPKEMIYQQRRAAYRALVGRALNVRAKLESRERFKNFDGRLFDISLTGCRINFEGEVAPEFVRSEVFERCAVTLLNGFTVDCPVTLKHARYDRDADETTCGFQFEGLDKTAQRAIDRFVYFLQREARRLETK